MFGQRYEDQSYSAGLYLGQHDGKFLIALETDQINNFDKLTAKLPHEIAHIKILGEGRLKENDEYLTDLTTVFFGLGIFNANASFQQTSSHENWSHSQQGYLLQQEWGYALALYAYIRNETKPDWVKYLTPNIQSDFRKSEAFIRSNTDKVLI